MLKKIIIASLLVTCLGGLLVTFGSVVEAAGNVTVSGGASGLIPCGNTSNYADRCTLCHLVVGIYGLIQWGMKLVTILAVVAIFIAGFMYILSAGDSGMMESSKNFIKSAVIGFAVMLTAWLLISTLMMVLGAKSNLGITGVGNWYTFNFTCQGNADSSVDQNPGDDEDDSEVDQNPGDDEDDSEVDQNPGDNNVEPGSVGW